MDIDVGTAPSGVVLEDLDNDGDIDIAVSNKNSNDITILLNAKRESLGPGWALQFDGIDDYVNIGSNSSLNLSSSFTISAWVYVADKSSHNSIVSRISDGSNFGYNFFIRKESEGGDIGFQFYSSSGWQTRFGVTVVTPNVWHHIAVTNNGIWLDGVETPITTVSSIDQGSQSLLLGKSTGQTIYYASYLTGKMDELSIWNRVLTDDEIKDNMKYTLTGNEPALVGYWRFDEATGTTASDVSGNGNTGTLTNGATWVISTSPLLGPGLVGNFTLDSTYTTGTAPNGITAYDFDGDGDVDLATANGSSNNISVLFNDGNGVFGGLTSVSAGSQPIALCANDLDADGDIDLACLNFSSNDVNILSNDGSGVFTASDTIGVGSGPRAITGLDISGEFGIMDLAVVNLSSGDVSILKNQIPEGSFVNISLHTSGEQSGDVDIDYSIYDVNNSNVGLLCQYSTNAGATWNSAAVEGDTSQLPPENYRGVITWNSRSDLPDVDERNVRFKITPYSPSTGMEGSAKTFVGYNEYKSTVPTSMSGSKGAPKFDLAPSGAFRDKRVETRRGDGISSIPATRLNDVVGQVNGGATHSLNRILGSAVVTGQPDSTDIFVLDNYQLHSVDVFLKETLMEYSDSVKINVTLVDTTHDVLSIATYYRTGTDEWAPATVAGNITNIDSSQYVQTLIWDSRADLGSADLENVELKFVPSDGWADGSADSMAEFHLDNNELPVVEVTDLVGEQTGDILLAYVLSDTENDTLDITINYSVDGGATWSKATVTGDTLGINIYSDTLIWNSKQDLPGRDIASVKLQLIPMDNDTGIVDTTAPFHLDNNDVPSITITDLDGEQSDDVTISYLLSDSENDSLTIVCEYYDDSTEIWIPATVSGDTSEITQYSNSIIWNTRQDLPEAAQYVLFRITPRDNDFGFTDTTEMLLDNIGVPSIAINTVIEGEVSCDLTFEYSIFDDEADTISLDAAYSINSGSSWSTVSVSGDTSDIDTTRYSGSLIWHSVTDLPGVDLHTVRFKITPRDVNVGISHQTADFHLDNNEPPSAALTELVGFWRGNIPCRIPTDRYGRGYTWHQL
ncbi:MAG: VCBS repeat-containing protein [Candidatus Marinimicrobia bacterium]|nr:VCBS repeat-containing protein [Candidatus Neomarinimicrobiota bacterium]